MTEYEKRSTRLTSGLTRAESPLPTALLTMVLPVEAKAISIIHTSPEMLRTMFETASARSPVCSMKRKKANHVPMLTKLCTIFHTATFQMGRIVRCSQCGRRERP